MTEIDTMDGLVRKLAAVPIADDAVMTRTCSDRRWFGMPTTGRALPSLLCLGYSP